MLQPSQESGCDEPSRGVYRNTALGRTLRLARLGALPAHRGQPRAARHRRRTCPTTSSTSWSTTRATAAAASTTSSAPSPATTSGAPTSSCTSSATPSPASPTSTTPRRWPTTSSTRAASSPREANITALLDPATLKWKDLVTAGTAVPDAVGEGRVRRHGQRLPEGARGDQRPIAAADARRRARRRGRDAEGRGARSCRWPTPARWTPSSRRARFAGKVGAFEGAGYAAEGLYRPQLDCIMFTKGSKPFCPVCERGDRARHRPLQRVVSPEDSGRFRGYYGRPSPNPAQGVRECPSSPSCSSRSSTTSTTASTSSTASAASPTGTRAPSASAGTPPTEAVGTQLLDQLLNHIDDDGRLPVPRPVPAGADDRRRQAAARPRSTSTTRPAHRVPVLVRVAPLVDPEADVIGAIEVFTTTPRRWRPQPRPGPREGGLRRPAHRVAEPRAHRDAPCAPAPTSSPATAWPFGVLFIDIDHFKADQRPPRARGGRRGAPRRSANTLRGAARTFDLVGRWGGEEFVAILANTDDEKLLAIAERFRALVEASADSTAGTEKRRYRLHRRHAGGRWRHRRDAVARADALMYARRSPGATVSPWEAGNSPSRGPWPDDRGAGRGGLSRGRTAGRPGDGEGGRDHSSGRGRPQPRGAIRRRRCHRHIEGRRPSSPRARRGDPRAAD